MMAFLRKLFWLAQRRQKEAELRDELDFHLSEEAELQAGTGVPEDAARSAARRELGNYTLVQEDTRAAWGWTLLDQLGQHIHYALRSMKSNRLHAASDSDSGTRHRREHRHLQLHGRHSDSHAASCPSAIVDRLQVACQNPARRFRDARHGARLERRHL